MVKDNANSHPSHSIHTLRIDQRKCAVVTGVTDVSSFDETEVVLKVSEGVVVLSGENLHVGKLVLEEGKLDVEGRIDSIVYETAKPTAGKFFSNWRVKR